ncbi:MAG TPA: hypothetical protein VGK96_17605 [Candidatus Sulfotelmatobacter sp.]
MSLASGLVRHGEDVLRIRGRDGEVEEVRLGGMRLLPEAEVAVELEKRYRG